MSLKCTAVKGQLYLKRIFSVFSGHQWVNLLSIVSIFYAHKRTKKGVTLPLYSYLLCVISSGEWSALEMLVKTKGPSQYVTQVSASMLDRLSVSPGVPL